MGFHTWTSIGKPLPKRVNIVLSSKANLENRADVLLLRSKPEVLALANYLKGDLFIIGGAKTYENFADAIEKWIVTEIPLTVENADAFMPPNFLEGFKVTETKQLDSELNVKIYRK